MLGRRSVNSNTPYEGITLRQAALVAGFAYLFNPVSYAEFSVYPKLVVASNVDQTVQNISAHLGLFAAAILCYIISFIGDVIIAWALYGPLPAKGPEPVMRVSAAGGIPQQLFIAKPFSLLTCAKSPSRLCLN
jgi:Domain of unknown function (DUF4386)